MRRREVLAGLGAAAWPLGSAANAQSRVRRMVFLAQHAPFATYKAAGVLLGQPLEPRR